LHLCAIVRCSSKARTPPEAESVRKGRRPLLCCRRERDRSLSHRRPDLSCCRRWHSMHPFLSLPSETSVAGVCPSSAPTALPLSRASGEVREARWEFSGKAQDRSPRSWCYRSMSLHSTSASSRATPDRMETGCGLIRPRHREMEDSYGTSCWNRCVFGVVERVRCQR
jgi:hypothetical protein